MANIVKYPVGQQSFKVLRETGCLYVDKTRFIEKLLTSGSRYYFLGRPRRFGKSLFLSTLKFFFLGERELFKGLYADTMDWDWKPRPVLYLDLNIEKYQQPEVLDQVLESSIIKWENEYGIVPAVENLSVRFSNVIETAFRKTGKKVVVLVDEYDKPLVSNLGSKELIEQARDRLASFYSNFKSSADYLQLVFLTGVSRFSHLTVFSGLNNILDISFLDTYSDICGITESELKECFQDGAAALAEKFGEDKERIFSEIKEWYDGYRFSPSGKEIYNPFSVLCLMNNEDFQNYWIQSGQATLLAGQLKRFNTDLEALVDAECPLSQLMGLDLDNSSLEALFYQTGYLTIKDYDRMFRTVRLGLPNREVKDGFMSYVLPVFTNPNVDDSGMLVYRLVDDLKHGCADDFMRSLQSFFAGISYEMNMDNERNFQNAFFILVKLVGIYVEAEKRTSDGRIDLFFATDKYYYIVELKCDGTAREALAQINDKNYAMPFSADGRRIIKIGADFSTKTRTLAGWLIEE